MPSLLLIRADANVTIATGHVMRCLALSQAWQDDGGEVMFVMADCSALVEEKLWSEGIRVVRIDADLGSVSDAAQTISLAGGCQAEWVVLDGYHFGAEYQRQLKDAGNRLLFVDDCGHADYYCSDIVLNQNPHAAEDFYRNRARQTKLLLGPRYAMLRREFRAMRDWRRGITPVARKLLVTMGGSDPDNVTPVVLDAIQQLDMDGLEVMVVVGKSNPHLLSLQERVAKSARGIRLVQNPPNMAELMTWADVAVAGAGATCWEMCFLGLPAVLIDLAENQTPIAEKLDSLGLALHAGSARSATSAGIAEKLTHLLQSGDLWRAMSLRGRDLVDGNGAPNVVRTMKDYGI